MKSLSTILLAASTFITGNAIALSVSISGQFFSPCGQPRGELHAGASGGVLPYTYVWSNGATTETISNLSAGSYTITVTDNLGTQATATQDITWLPEYPTLNPVVSTTHCPAGSPYAFFPILPSNNPTFITPTEPTNFIFGNQVGQFVSDDGGFWIIELDGGSGTWPITYSDALGCMGVFNFILDPPVDLQAISVTGIGGSCSNGSFGTATVNLSGSAGENEVHIAIKDAQGNALYDNTCSGGQVGGWPGSGVPLTSLAPGDYWVVLDVDRYCLFNVLPDFLAPCADSVMFTVPDLGIPCGEVIGTLYVDADGDCVLDAGENTVPNTVIAIAPGSNYTSTGNNGWYGTDALPGPTTFTEQQPILSQSCPGIVNVVSGTTQTLDIGLAPNAPLDVMVSMGATPMRPGMQAHYHIQARNLTDAATGTVTLTLQLDANLDFVSASPTPTTVAGSLITWTDPDFTMTNVFEMDQFHVSVSLPPNPALVGTQINSIATVSAQNTELPLANNIANIFTTVTASLDPNDKLVRTVYSQSDHSFFIPFDEEIDYTIRFQNTGTDTAFSVVITDTLPPQVDPSSLMVGASSHPMNWSISGPGIVRFTFPNILLPDSTTNEPASHGLVTFRVRANPQLLPGTEITNNADIFFDFNDPVRTNDAVLIVEIGEGVAERSVEGIVISPNPVSDELRIRANTSIASVRVVAADGREVHAQRVQASAPAINVLHLRAGAYLLITTFTNGTEARERFIKQ